MKRKIVEFDLTRDEFKELSPKIFHIYGTGLSKDDDHPPGPDSKKRYKAELPLFYALGAPQIVLDYVLKS